MSANDKAAATYGPGRTTPPLEARVAEVLTAHSYAGMDGQYADRCKCGWAGNGDAETAKHQASMLAPVIAEALREAADELEYGNPAAQFLHDRADNLEKS